MFFYVLRFFVNYSIWNMLNWFLKAKIRVQFLIFPSPLYIIELMQSNSTQPYFFILYSKLQKRAKIQKNRFEMIIWCCFGNNLYEIAHFENNSKTVNHYYTVIFVFFGCSIQTMKNTWVLQSIKSETVYCSLKSQVQKKQQKRIKTHKINANVMSQ